LAPADQTIDVVVFYQFGADIDTDNPDPESAVTYTQDSIGNYPGTATWDSTPIFKNIKPCVFKNGEVQYYLHPNDFTQKADSSPAVIDGTDGDVMIEIPRLGFNISRF
jgi:hypothetical protein